jgi:DNA-binding transcriptional regulator GbsR (MarR family)
MVAGDRGLSQNYLSVRRFSQQIELGNNHLNEILTEKIEESVKPDAATLRLESAEVEVIHLFVQFGKALGLPRSVAEIYGLLFASPRPLAMDTLVERLNLSKGSASQGLKYLLDLGAVRTVYVAGDRRTHYEAVAELRKLAGRFLRQQILSRFEDSPHRLDRIALHAQTLSEQQRKHLGKRLELLRRWERKGRRIWPFVLNILGSD